MARQPVKQNQFYHNMMIITWWWSCSITPGPEGFSGSAFLRMRDHSLGQSTTKDWMIKSKLAEHWSWFVAWLLLLLQLLPVLLLLLLTVRSDPLNKYFWAASLVYSTLSRHLSTYHILPPGQVGDVVAAGDVPGEGDLRNDRSWESSHGSLASHWHSLIQQANLNKLFKPFVCLVSYWGVILDSGRVYHYLYWVRLHSGYLDDWIEDVHITDHILSSGIGHHS